MDTQNKSRQPSRLWARGLALLGLAAGAWVATVGWTPAYAGDVYWSVGVSGPGVVVGASNAPAVGYRPPPAYYYQPAPVVVVPPPGYGHHHHRPPPQVVYVQPPYGYAPPVVVAPRPIVIGGRGDRWRQDDRWDDRHRGHHRRDWDDDRGYNSRR